MKREELNRIIAYVDTSIDETGCSCLEVEWEPDSKTLRVFIDNLNGAVGIDECVAVNQRLEDAPLIDDLVQGSYNLEVSSPGVERPLRLATHFKQVLGKSVEVKLSEQVSGRKHGVGKVINVDDSGQIALDTSRGKWEFPVSMVLRASLRYDWSAAQENSNH